MKSKAAPLPHSWPQSEWPPEVYPNRTSAGKNLVRTHRQELQKYGALSRVGREVVVLGAGFAAFLASKMGRVDGYIIAPNRSESAETTAP